MHRKSSARKVTHPSIKHSSLRRLNPKLPMGFGLRPWQKPPFRQFKPFHLSLEKHIGASNQPMRSVVFEFEQRATYFGSSRAELILAPLGMPK